MKPHKIDLVESMLDSKDDTNNQVPEKLFKSQPLILVQGKWTTIDDPLLLLKYNSLEFFRYSQYDLIVYMIINMRYRYAFLS
ncbi:unnamed protein product [Heterobilharzia americana]|nr:unnamed protein product [Heterobilharzia americana]